jgi:ornithine decarboxylase
VRSNYNRFARGLPGFRVFFPLKACSHPSVLGTLFQEGASFDAASLLEIRILTGLGVPVERIAFTTPIKPAAEIRRAAGLGVRCFVADCAMEVEKLAAEAPGSNVLVRIGTHGKGSRWPLSQRFGIAPGAAAALLHAVQKSGLVPHGLAFHVGSQCLDPGSWTHALGRCARIMDDFERRGGRPLRVVNIGGGFPVRYLSGVPALEQFFAERLGSRPRSHDQISRAQPSRRPGGGRR